MSDELTLDAITTRIAEVAATLPSTGKIIKMEIGLASPIVYDGTVTPPVVDNSDKEANATISMEHATFIALAEGKTTGPAAMMMGKLKIAGDMPAALSFQAIMDRVQKTYRNS